MRQVHRRFALFQRRLRLGQQPASLVQVAHLGQHDAAQPGIVGQGQAHPAPIGAPLGPPQPFQSAGVVAGPPILARQRAPQINQHGPLAAGFGLGQRLPVEHAGLGCLAQVGQHIGLTNDHHQLALAVAAAPRPIDGLSVGVERALVLPQHVQVPGHVVEQCGQRPDHALGPHQRQCLALNPRGLAGVATQSVRVGQVV